MFKHNSRWLLGLALLTIAAAAGCGENIAVIHRPAPEVNGEEITGEITGIDRTQNEIYLRATDGRSNPSRTVRYDANTQVIYQGRDYPVSALEVGDVVALQVWQRDRGNVTDLIRVQQNGRDRGAARPLASRQRIEGTVEAVARGGVFDLRDQGGASVTVTVAPDARAAVLNQVERLRRGDYVLAEGRYVGRDRFELDNLL